MKRVHWIGLATVALAAAIWFAFVLGRDAEDSAGKNAPTAEKRRPALLLQKGAAKSAVKPVVPRPAAERVVTNKTGMVMRSSLGGRVRGSDDGIFRDENGKAYPPKDQELMRRARDAIDNDDLDGARALAAEALGSKNDELRSMAVDALAWFGQDAMVELTGFMGDANEEVAEAAKSSWVGALQEIEDEGVKAGTIEVALKSLRDRDMLEDVANELVGIDDLAAIQVVADILSDGGNAAAAAAAKEVYNTITGEDWTGVDDAESWLQENYAEPEEEDPET